MKHMKYYKKISELKERLLGKMLDSPLVNA